MIFWTKINIIINATIFGIILSVRPMNRNFCRHVRWPPYLIRLLRHSYLYNTYVFSKDMPDTNMSFVIAVFKSSYVVVHDVNFTQFIFSHLFNEWKHTLTSKYYVSHRGLSTEKTNNRYVFSYFNLFSPCQIRYSPWKAKWNTSLSFLSVGETKLVKKFEVAALCKIVNVNIFLN